MTAIKILNEFVTLEPEYRIEFMMNLSDVNLDLCCQYIQEDTTILKNLFEHIFINECSRRIVERRDNKINDILDQ